MNAKPESDFRHDDAEVVCPHCVQANAPSMAFCVYCGAPLGMVSTIDPIQSIYAEGFAYRSAVDGPPKLILLIGMWLLFLPMAGTSLVLLFTMGGPGPGIITPFLFLASVGVLFRMTRNYIVKSRAAKKAEDLQAD